MALGGEIDDRPGAILPEQPRDQCALADVAVHEDMPGVAAQRVQVGEIAGVSELVEIDDRGADLADPVEHEIRADESGAAGHQDRAFREHLGSDTRDRLPSGQKRKPAWAPGFPAARRALEGGARRPGYSKDRPRRWRNGASAAQRPAGRVPARARRGRPSGPPRPRPGAGVRAPRGPRRGRRPRGGADGR